MIDLKDLAGDARCKAAELEKEQEEYEEEDKDLDMDFYYRCGLIEAYQSIAEVLEDLAQK